MCTWWDGIMTVSTVPIASHISAERTLRIYSLNDFQDYNAVYDRSLNLLLLANWTWVSLIQHLPNSSPRVLCSPPLPSALSSTSSLCANGAKPIFGYGPQLLYLRGQMVMVVNNTYVSYVILMVSLDAVYVKWKILQMHIHLVLSPFGRFLCNHFIILKDSIVLWIAVLWSGRIFFKKQWITFKLVKSDRFQIKYLMLEENCELTLHA